LGKVTAIDGLIANADNHLPPTWEHCGLYYPRNDLATDEEGHWTYMYPFSGNSADFCSWFSVENGEDHDARHVDEMNSCWPY
jgi:hypothetical protein